MSLLNNNRENLDMVAQTNFDFKTQNEVINVDKIAFMVCTIQ